VYGGPGCPAVAEFAPAEFGAVTGRGKVAAAHYIGQALALRHRLPDTWEQVRNGHATEWKARQVATACLGLSDQAVAYVDERVAHILDTLTPLRVERIVRAAKWQADPEAARAEAEEKARERGVWPGRTDDHGTTTLFVRAATGDVIRFNATIAQIADALAALGDTDPLDQRRAKAVGIIADPGLAHRLLEVAQHLATTNPPAATSTAAGSPSPAMPATSTPTTPSGEQKPEATESATEPESASATEPETASGAVPETAAAAESGTAAATVTEPETKPESAAEPGTERESAAEPGTEPESAAESAGGSELGVGAASRIGTGVAGAGEAVDREWRWEIGEESDAEAEADRDTPHPSAAWHPLEDWTASALAPFPDLAPDRDTRPADADAAGMDDAARRELAGTLAAIKQAADRDGIESGGNRRAPARTVLYAHITDQTLLADDGVARIEGFGPTLVARLSELLGHDQIVIRPVIDLNDTISVDAYEIPHRICERVKLKHPVEQFPYGTAETGINTDLDHITPYNKNGPPGQTSTKNLGPLGRLSHRIKTHGGWNVTRLDNDTLEWTTRYGFKLHVTHRGTYLIHGPTEPDKPDKERPDEDRPSG
jgi:hypothetical protein